MDHFVDLIPSVPESVSRDGSVGHEDGSVGLLWQRAHTTGSVSSYNQTSHGDASSNGSEDAIDLDGMNWDLIEEDYLSMP